MNTVAWRDRAFLPSEPGVYFCYRNHDILYIGESSNIALRWDSPRYGLHNKIPSLQKLGCTHISWRVYRNEARRRHEEAIAIRRHNPPLNLKQEPINFSVLWGDRIARFLSTAILTAITIRFRPEILLALDRLLQ